MNEIKEPALEFWSNPKAAQIFIDKLNEVIRNHNNLAAEVEELNQMIDMINDAVFSIGDTPTGLNS